MHQTPSPVQEETEEPLAEPRLLIELEPRSSVFVENIRDLFQRPMFFNRQSQINNQQSLSTFWPDVFVDRALHWRSFLQSAAYHVLAIAIIWAGTRLLALQPHATSQSAFTHSEVIHYTASQYLPPLDTRRSHSAHARKSDPEFSQQPIISVPHEPDNRSQTIVTAPHIQLQHDVTLPNVVAWSGKPQVPIGPAPAVPASETSRLAPQIERSVIAPPPDLQSARQKIVQALQTAVIAPPPAMESNSTRRPGDLNIARSSVIAPAPQLALDEQRAIPGRSSFSKHSQDVIAPPPSLGTGRSHSGNSMIALNLKPAVGAPPNPPAGNRRGNFAATPEGHRGASGTPDAAAENGRDSAAGSGKKNSNLPSGLYVGKTSNATSPVAGDPEPKNEPANTVNPNLLANARPPRIPARTQPEGESKLSEEERAVFGTRKFYSLSLSMPNLNSAGGSWIVRFAALKPDNASGTPSSRATSGDSSDENLSAPTATRKVDPAYPELLMRQNIGGTVILYAVIHSDGTVGNVRVLRSVDDRIDHFASAAIAKWQFQPATKNGAPVDVEATFSIPFRPSRVGSNF